MLWAVPGVPLQCPTHPASLRGSAGGLWDRQRCKRIATQAAGGAPLQGGPAGSGGGQGVPADAALWGVAGRWVSPCSVVFRGVVGVLGRLHWLASSLEGCSTVLLASLGVMARHRAGGGAALLWRIPGRTAPCQLTSRRFSRKLHARSSPQPAPTAPIPQPRLARAGLAPPALIDPNSLQTAAKSRRRGTDGRTRGGPARCLAGGLPRSLQPLTPTRDLLAARRDRRETPQRRLLAQRRRRRRCGGGLATMQQEQEQEEQQPAAAAQQQQPAAAASSPAAASRNSRVTAARPSAQARTMRSRPPLACYCRGHSRASQQHTARQHFSCGCSNQCKLSRRCSTPSRRS